MTDDSINLKVLYGQKLKEQQRQIKDRIEGMKNEEPFYERLRREDAARVAENRKNYVEKRVKMSQAAAYLQGKCMLDTKNFEDYAKEDEIKALAEHEKIQNAIDAERQRIEDE